jgi:hypothetical protein
MNTPFSAVHVKRGVGNLGDQREQFTHWHGTSSSPAIDTSANARRQHRGG